MSPSFNIPICIINYRCASPYTNLDEFAALSMVLEGVGVSAYLGAAASIINKDYLTAAGSILTTEARHAAYVSSVPPNSQAPWSTAFDVPLDFDEVYSLAGLSAFNMHSLSRSDHTGFSAPFITSCPSTNPALPVKKFPALNVTTTGYTAGSNVTMAFAANSTDNVTDMFVAFLSGSNATYARYDAPSKSCLIPATLAGAGTVYAVVTTSNSSNGTAPTDDSTIAGPAVLLFPSNSTVRNSSTAMAGVKTNDGLRGNREAFLGWTAVMAAIAGLAATTM